MAQRVADGGAGELRMRTLSSVVLAPIAVAAIIAGTPWFNLLILVIGMVLAVEWHRLYQRDTPGWLALSLEGSAVAGTILLGTIGQPSLAVVALGVAGAVMAALFRRHRAGVWGPIGVVYIGVPCLSLVWLRSDPLQGAAIVLWLVLVVWATDIGAFFAGRAIGGPKLWPAISPSKTWSGLVGGMILAALVGYVGEAVLAAPETGWLGLMGAPMALVAQGGDLTESAVKRHFGVKDSGQLIPGHGGLFDRVDGLLFVATALAVLSLLSAADR